MSRAPIDTTAGRPTSAAELTIARQVIRRSGLVDVLAPFIDAEVGRPRLLGLEALLVVFQLNALHRHHQAHLVEAARILNALTDEQRAALSITSWDPDETYDRVERLFVKLCQVLDSDEAGIDATDFANELARAAIPTDLLTSRSVAVDGTDVETWGALRGASFTVELDGEAADTQLMDEEPASTARQSEDEGEDGQGVQHRPRWAQALHRGSRRPSRSPVGDGQLAMPGPMSDTSSIWLSRPETCAGPTTSTRPPSDPRSPA